jgi:hypothetical protein
VCLLTLVTACGEGGTAPDAAPRGLAIVARVASYAHAVGWDGDGHRWYADDGRELAVYEGAWRIATWPLPIGPQDRILPLGGRGVLVGPYLPDLAGRDVAGIEEHAMGYGRFAGVEATSVSPDGEAVLVEVRDYPSACDCGHEERTRDPEVLLVAPAREGGTTYTTLVEDEGVDAIAAGPRQLAVLAGATLRIWSRTPEAAPRTITLGDWFGTRRMEWTADGASLVLVGPRDVLVLDATRDFAPRARWTAADYPADAALAPDGTLALALLNAKNDYRLELHHLDGTLEGSLAVPSVLQLAWRPDSRALLVATPGEILRVSR